MGDPRENDRQLFTVDESCDKKLWHKNCDPRETLYLIALHVKLRNFTQAFC